MRLRESISQSMASPFQRGIDASLKSAALERACPEPAEGLRVFRANTVRVGVSGKAARAYRVTMFA